MPRNAAVAKRYARALFDLGQEGAGKLDQALEELQGFSKALESDPVTLRFLVNPVLSKEEKVDVLKALEKELPNSYRFLVLLVQADRFEFFGEILHEFKALCEGLTGELSVRVETARSLPEKVMNNIQKLLEERWEKKVKISQEVNPELIGGFVARAPGRIVDASVRSQLEYLQQQVAS